MRDLFRNLSSIYDGSFLAKTVNSLQLLIIFAECCLVHSWNSPRYTFEFYYISLETVTIFHRYSERNIVGVDPAWFVRLGEQLQENYQDQLLRVRKIPDFRAYNVTKIRINNGLCYTFLWPLEEHLWLFWKFILYISLKGM